MKTRDGDNKSITTVDQDRIEAAVRTAEARCGAEIVVVVTDTASNYMATPLAWATALVIIAPIIPLFLVAAAMNLFAFIDGWGGNPSYEEGSKITAVAQFAGVQLALFVFVLGILTIAPVRRALTPSWAKRSAVHRLALEQFIARGLTHTPQRTGLLVFVSQRDRTVEIIADIGLSAVIPHSDWRAARRALEWSLRRNELAIGVVAAIDACARKVEHHFPAPSSGAARFPDRPAFAPHAGRVLQGLIEHSVERQTTS